MQRYLDNATQKHSNFEKYLQELKNKAVAEETENKALPADRIVGTILVSNCFKKGDYIRNISETNNTHHGIYFNKANDYQVNNESGKQIEYFILVFDEQT